MKFDKNILTFKITDTGRGISRDQREHLFQAFSQADSSTTRKFGGTGLGLVLTKKLSAALGGDFILSESELGKGSTFEVTIQVRLPSETVPFAVTARPLQSAESGGEHQQENLKEVEVLLVEDSPDNQFLVQKLLEKTGVRIALANNGAEGVELALDRRFDVVLMDIQMPVMDGHEAVRTLRAKGYVGPIVALTAHAMKEERERAIQSGFSHFLTKPIIKKSLIDLLALFHSPLSLRL